MSAHEPLIIVRPRAAARIPEFAAESGGDENTLIRLRVTEHDSSSLAYTMRFESSADNDDVVFSTSGLTFCVDSASALLLDGIEISYYDGAARIEQGTNPRKPAFDPSLGILATITVHCLSPDQLWESGQVVSAGPSHSGSDFHPNGQQSPNAPTRNSATASGVLTPQPSRDNSDAAENLRRLLDSELGLNCLAKFWKQQVWRVTRRESDDFITQYIEKHLEFLTRFIEPLTQLATQDTCDEFLSLCNEMSPAPNLSYVSMRFGFSAVDEEDVTLWLNWAGNLESDPAKCLYCVAGFVSVPPFAGIQPVMFSAVISGLAASSLLALGNPRLSSEVIEHFLELAEQDYNSADSLRTALKRSPLSKVESPQRHMLLEVLHAALSAGTRQSHAAILEVARQFGI